MNQPHLSYLEKTLLLLIYENDGKYTVYRYIDKFPKFFRDEEGVHCFESFANLGFFADLGKESSIEDFRNTKITLSASGKEVVEHRILGEADVKASNK